MRLRAALGFSAAAACLAAAAARAPAPAGWKEVVFHRRVLDSHYRSEGAAVADVDRDGKPDILAGNLWYSGAGWRPHEIAPPLTLDPARDKSNAYLTFAHDLNRDGWVDEIIIGRPGTVCQWRENPGRQNGPWKERLLYHSACNESPHFTRLFGSGQPVLVFGLEDDYLAWFEPGRSLNEEFIPHRITESKVPAAHHFAHGLGVGDINGDGRKDLICREGFWIAPADRGSAPWKFVSADLGPECAQMHVYDVNDDGLPDVVSSSAHHFGVWWYEQRSGANGPEFVAHEIDRRFSQSHAMEMADIDGDGVMDFVTGKRFWAHGPDGDDEPNAPAVLHWYELRRRAGKVEWIPHRIDDDSGVGVMVTVQDVNGDSRPDIVIANKKGVFLFEQG